MLGQRIRRWPNIEPTFGERLLFAGSYQRHQNASPAPSRLACVDLKATPRRRLFVA